MKDYLWSILIIIFFVGIFSFDLIMVDREKAAKKLDKRTVDSSQRTIYPPPGCSVIVKNGDFLETKQSFTPSDRSKEYSFWYRTADPMLGTEYFFIIAPDGSWEQTDGIARVSVIKFITEFDYWFIQNEERLLDGSGRRTPPRKTTYYF